MNDARAQIETLIGKVAGKDRAAFLDLYDRTSAKLFAVCLRVSGNEAEAEEVLQETYVKVWRNAHRYTANGLSPMTWLITVARNSAIDRLRARRPETGGEEVTETLRDEAPGPEAQAVAASEAREVMRCLGELEADRAAAVRGAYLGGESYADLAKRFDVPLNTMRTWLRRSLIKLRECLET